MSKGKYELDKKDLSQVMQMLGCDFKAGTLYWKVDIGNYKIGDIAGNKGDGSGKYSGVTLRLRRGKRSIRRSWIIWAIKNGRWPKDEIDHINCDPRDDRLVNLREATSRQNKANRSVRSINKSGLKGVSLHRQSGLWRARLGAKGITTYHKTKNKAHEAYILRAKAEYGEFARS